MVDVVDVRADNEDFEILVDVNLLGKDCDGPQILRLVSPMRKMSKEKINISN